MLSAPLVLAGQLLAIAFACGLNLYATIAVVGLSSRLGLITHLPPGMRGLESGVVIGIAAGLYLAEFIADRVPVLDNAWEALHAFIRPVAAGALTFLALHDASTAIQVAGGAAAAGMALAAHASKTGIRFILANRHRRAGAEHTRTIARLAVCVIEDLIAITIAIAALLYPSSAIFIVAAALAILLIAGPRLWRAALLGLRAVFARARGFFGQRAWRTREDLPRGMRAALPVEPLGRSPARATPVAVTGLPSVGAYRHGWLVFTCDGPRFLYRSMFGARCLTLPPVSDVTLRKGVMTDTLDVLANSGGTNAFTIYLLKDGAPPHVTAAELSANPS